jgi:hypothetical protein
LDADFGDPITPFGLLARKTFKIMWLSNLSILSVPYYLIISLPLFV